jgi:hypothetical protein
MPSLSVEQMRMYLLGFYGERWKKRVRKMEDRQVIAAYYRIKSQEKKKR